MNKNKIIEFFNWLINSINPFPRMTKLMRMLDDIDVKVMSLGIWIWMTLMLYGALTLWTSSILLGIYIHWSLPDITDMRILPVLILTILYLNRRIDKL